MWFAASNGFGMKHLSRLLERVIVQLRSDRKWRLLALDRKGKRVLKNQNHCQAGRSRQKHSNDHPLTLNFPKRHVEASESLISPATR